MFFSESNSQGLVEFVLIVAVITIIVIAVLLLFGPTIGNVFSKINSSIPGYLE
jgi:Flp pilus assembly pilin Flp